MMNLTLQACLCAVTPPDETARAEARRRWNRCAKPLGSLGLLEAAIEDIAALTGSADIRLTEKAVLVLCGDNGVAAGKAGDSREAAITQTDRAVTGIVARKLALGRTAVCRMADAAGCRVVPVDMGIADFTPFPGVLDRSMGNGTADFTQGPAMSRQQAEDAILTGIRLAEEERDRGTALLAAGEMGIGNTTTASAVASVLLNRPPEAVTGRGAGLSDAGLAEKIRVIRRGLKANRPDRADILDVLSKVGGFDLAGMCGIYLGGALYGVPVLMDGFPSSVAALCAVRLCPPAAKAVFASHVSAEPAGKRILEALGRRPLLTAEMRLGEGTGAVAVMPLLDMALAVYRDAYTFEEAGIPPYQAFSHAPESPVFPRRENPS